MHYDVAAKIWLETGTEIILKYLAGINVQKAEILTQLPQETVSMRSTDFPILITDNTGQKSILVLEIQSSWDKDKPLIFNEYCLRFKRKYPDFSIIPLMLLLTENKHATDEWKSEFGFFRFNLVKIWEMDSDYFIKPGFESIWPIVPLMKNGMKFARRIEEDLYQSDFSKGKKLDLLMSFIILLGLIDKNLSLDAYNRRRNFMIESPIYDIIIQEGIEKGIEKGKIEGKIEVKFEIARKMKDVGDSIDKIILITGLSKEEIEKL